MPQEYVEIAVQATAVARGGATKNIFNIFHYRRTNTVLTTSKAHIESAFQADVVVPMLAFLSVDYVQSSTTIRFFDDALDAPVPFAETGVGAITGDRMETFVAAVIQLKTGTRGRFARGSKHFAPIAESASVGDVLTSGSQTLLTAIGTALVDGFSDSDANFWQAVVKSNKPPAQYKTNPVTIRTYDIIGFKINKSTGTMRRRKIPSVY